MSATIRPYVPSDREACLGILRSNTPEFFLASDEADYAGFLDQGPGSYVVVEDGGRVVACGGWFLEGEGTAGLSWGMVRRDLHGTGLGRSLLEYRMGRIGETPGIRSVILQTIPEVAGFFEQAGFEVASTEPGAYGGVFDRVRMRRDLPAR